MEKKDNELDPGLCRVCRDFRYTTIMKHECHLQKKHRGLCDVTLL